MTPDEFDDMTPDVTETLLEEIERRDRRHDQLAARLGMFIYSAQGTRAADGRRWSEQDFMPRKPLTVKQQQIMDQITAMKLEAKIRREQDHGS